MANKNQKDIYSHFQLDKCKLNNDIIIPYQSNWQRFKSDNTNFCQGCREMRSHNVDGRVSWRYIPRNSRI